MGLASLGHLYTAAAAALLAGSCMPSWAERSGGAQALLQVGRQPPGPTGAQRRAPPRSRLPGPSRPAGAPATQPEGRGPQRRARLRQLEHCLTQITVPPPYFPALNPATTACHKGPSNQRSVTRRRRRVTSAALGLDDSGAAGASRRPPLPAPPCCAEGPRAEVPEPSR